MIKSEREGNNSSCLRRESVYGEEDKAEGLKNKIENGMRRRESETETMGINQERSQEGGDDDTLEKLKERYPRGLYGL